MADLIVTRAIAGYAKGERITDPAVIAKITATRAGRSSTVRVAAVSSTASPAAQAVSTPTSSTKGA